MDSMPTVASPKSALAGFMDFIRAQGVVGLAVGLVLGGAVTKVVGSLVADLVSPLLGLVLGSTQGLASLSLGVFKIGSFITSVIDFVVIAAVVYFIVKGFGFDKMDKKG
jgi:large conductance mechanosensitive channel